MQLRSVPNQQTDASFPPLIHWAAVSSAAVIGSALALVAGSLWAAAAFSSQNGAFYNHLDWWFGGTMIGAAFVASVVAGALSTSRGPAAGIVNGLSSWALLALATGGLVAVAAITGTTTSKLTLNNDAVVNVAFITPYVAFWSVALGLGAATIGGFAGGLIPRRAAINTAGTFQASANGLESSPASNRTPSRVAG